MSKYINPEPTEQETWFDYMYARLEKCLNEGDRKKTEDIAFEWAQGTCDHLGIEYVGIWKYFKRSLVAKWFGKPPSKRFSPGWSIQAALDYAGQFNDRSVRFSLFPKNIACHALSNTLPMQKKEHWTEILSKVDNTIAMEMFPETSTNSSICFRRYSTLFSEIIFYEAGKGQAMFTFEQERGMHPVVSAIIKGNDVIYSLEEFAPDEESKEIKRELICFIQNQNSVLSSKCFGLCRSVGIDHVSIEGYFDPSKQNDFMVVDIDLPFDVAFMGPKNNNPHP